MDLEDIMLSEIGQTQKNKYRYDLTYLWNPKKEKKKTNQIYRYTEQKQTGAEVTV